MTFAHEVKCEVCGVNSAKTALFRNGPKGQKVPWRCRPHLDPQWIPDKDVLAITNLIEEHNSK